MLPGVTLRLTFESGGLTVMDSVCVAPRTMPSARTPRSTEYVPATASAGGGTFALKVMGLVTPAEDGKPETCTQEPGFASGSGAFPPALVTAVTWSELTLRAAARTSASICVASVPAAPATTSLPPVGAASCAWQVAGTAPSCSYETNERVTFAATRSLTAVAADN